MGIFKAGSAIAVVNLDAQCFPNAESVAQRGEICARAVIFETDRRYAILSVDMPSMFENDVTFCRELLQETAGVAPEDGWITVTHCYSAPHTWGLDGGPGGGRQPKAIQENPEIRAATARINAAFRAAYRQAVEGALADLREAVIGFGAGTCSINTNRNMLTQDGWWKGVNHEGYTDKTLTVVRFDDLQGKPIAILYNYSMQISAGSGPIPDAGGRVSSADVAGVASRYIEKEFGDGCVALFLCGAAGDQVPLLVINYCETDRDGKLREGSLGSAGFAVVDAQGILLGNAAVQVTAQIKCTAPVSRIRTAQRVYTCHCQKRDGEMSSKRPTHDYSFIPDGTKDLPLYAMVFDDIALVGLLPEMDGITVAQIRENSPYEKTLVAAFVNGNAKSMPQAESYELLQYTAINSPFVAGSAEQTRDAAVELLKSMKE
ncbi:MAG: hypothetical protein ACI4O5_01305 [Oscillospiraceae bacterium]